MGARHRHRAVLACHLRGGHDPAAVDGRSAPLCRPDHGGRVCRADPAGPSVDGGCDGSIRTGPDPLGAGGHIRGGAGSSYVATAVVPAAAANPSAGAPPAAAPPGAETALGPIPASIRTLALSITSGEPTLLGKAEALTDFFRSGRFHYSVTAPAPSGRNPLVSFLSVTRTGSCEQFAGAFAVLARAFGSGGTRGHRFHAREVEQRRECGPGERCPHVATGPGGRGLGVVRADAPASLRRALPPGVLGRPASAGPIRPVRGRAPVSPSRSRPRSCPPRHRPPSRW